MVYKIVWTFRARKDIKSIKEYVAQDSLYYAQKLIARIYERVDVLQEYPEIGIPVFPEKFKHLRKLLYQSYRIVHHQSRLLENIPQIKDYKE
jgi:plasmid stabilization system protein ParE